MQKITMWIVPALQIIIALGLINVWIVRSNRSTRYRGANAHNMREEFKAYGLPNWFMYLIGFLKLVIAAALILVAFMPSLMLMVGLPAVALLAVLMLGAVSMHIKVKDSLVKTLPALGMLAMAVAVGCLVLFGD